MGNQDNNLKAFFNHITDFLFILDLNGNILEINNAVTEKLGYTIEELKGKSVLMVHPPEFREQAKEIVGAMLSGQRDVCPLPLLMKNNDYMPVETRIYYGQWQGEKVIIGLSRNLSDLALSEGKFREVFNNSLSLMVISELETGLIIDVNRQFLKTLGYSKDEVIGKTSKELSLYYDFNLRADYAGRLRKNEKIENEDGIVVSKSGKLILSNVSVSLIKIQTHVYVLTIINDITKLKQAEKKLKHSLKQQTLLADIANTLNSVQDIDRKLDEVLWVLGRHTDVSRVYIFETDTESNTTSNTFEWCNKGIMPQKEYLQKIPNEMIPSWRPMLEAEGKIECSDIRLLPEDLYKGLEPQQVKSILAFPLYVHGCFIGAIGFDECIENKTWELDEVELLRAISNIISNTIERIKIQKQLSNSEAQLKMAIENTETGLWDWNIKTGDVYYNDIWCSMLGYDRSEIAPSVSTWERLVHPDDMPGINVALEAHMSGKEEVYMTTHRLLTKSGEWKWVIDKGKIIEWDKEGKPFRAIGTHTDIDSQKKTEAELLVANATKDKFLSIIAHDLRGPIGTMSQIAEVLSGEEALDDETLKTFLKTQKDVSRDTYNLLDNLLGWARYNRDQITANTQIINLNSIISDCINVLKYQAERKNITLTAGLTDQFTAYADEDMVRLIIRNLLSNAVKFTPENGRITVELKNEDDHIKISIIDNGIGIPKENIEAILSDDRFLTTFGTHNEKGSGLGLKLCRNFVTVNKGTLIISSVPSQGSTFTFTLPLAQA